MLDRLARRPLVSALLVAASLAAATGGTLATGQEPSAAVGPAVTAAPDGPRPGDEIVSKRTRSSRTFAAEHGALRTRFFGDDVNFKDAGGAWQEIDNTLVPAGESGYAFRNAANSWTVDLPPRLGGAPVRVREDGRWVSFALEEAGAPGEAAGNTATYRDAVGNVDVSYVVRGSAVKETLTLASADAASSYSFAVRASSGLEARIADGAVEFVDAGGTVRFSFARPFMVDAAGERSDDVRFGLEPSGSGWELALVADQRWLEAPGREFPVEIDPTTMSHGDVEADQAGTDKECHVVGGTSANTSFCWNGGMQAGFDGTKKYRALMQWANIHDQIKRDSLILDAKMGLYVDWIDWGNNATWNVHRLTRGFTTNATWNKYDGTNAWTAAGGDFDPAVAASKQIANTMGWHSWRITELVQDWASGTHPNLGLMLKQATETVQNRLDIFYSDGGDIMPRLDILYVPRGGSQPQYTMYSDHLNDRMGLNVNVANGNLIVSANDVHISGTAGHDLSIVRSYNSVPGGWKGFGAWEMNTGADLELQVLENGDIVYWGPNAQVAVFRKNADGTYKNPTGLNAKLVKNADGTYDIRFFKTEEKLKFTTAGKLNKHVDRNGNELRFFYTADGYLQKITDSQNRDTTFTLDGDPGRKMVKTITDPAGRVHTYSYPDGFLQSYTDPAGGVTSFAYETSGQLDRLKQITDPEGNVTKFTYVSGCLEWQEPCRVTKIERMKVKSPAAYDVTTFDYQAGDSPCPNVTDPGDPKVAGHTIITDARGNETTGDTTDGKTTYCYDRELRVVWTKNQEGHIVKNKYSPNSNVMRYTNALTAQTNAHYDTSDRLDSTTRPATGSNSSATSTIGYVNRGDSHFPSHMIDAQGKRWNYTYTGNSNLAAVRQGPEFQGTDVPEFETDYNDGGTGDIANNGTVRWTKDGNQNRTDYGYDTAGNLTSITPPSGSGQNPITFTYSTQLSRVTTITDGKGQKRVFTYDGVDRVKDVKFYNSAGTLLRTNTYTYDKNGNRLTRSDASGSYTWTFDPKNRQVTESRPGLTQALYAYDANDNLSSLTHAGTQVLYTYYPDNLVKEIKEPGTPTPTTTYTYNANNNRTGATYPNGVVETATFDNGQRPDVLTASKSGTTLVSLNYDWAKSDGIERDLVQKLTDNRPTTPAATVFDYDDLGRVRDANTTGGRTDRWQYEYDGASNRTLKTHAGTTTHYKYDSGNELCWRHTASSTNTCASPPAGATVYSHDANGNLTAGGGFSAAYNVLDQTSSIGSTAFEYAGEGQTERTKQGLTDYGWSLLGSSSERTAGNTTYVLREPDGGLVGQKLPSGARFYYQRDALGSVMSMSDSAGTEANRYVYNDPYGESVTQTGSTSNPWKFAGEYADTSDRYKIGERYYVPSLGRFTQPDPHDLNPYTYVGGDPVNLADPSGLVRDPGGSGFKSPWGGGRTTRSGGGGGAGATPPTPSGPGPVEATRRAASRVATEAKTFPARHPNAYAVGTRVYEEFQVDIAINVVRLFF